MTRQTRLKNALQDGGAVIMWGVLFIAALLAGFTLSLIIEFIPIA